MYVSLTNDKLSYPLSDALEIDYLPRYYFGDLKHMDGLSSQDLLKLSNDRVKAFCDQKIVIDKELS